MPSRETELYKDKVEISLDGRQIFYLFFGGAVIVGIVFVLGVMVGRRVEARGHLERARTASASDPLAALDRLEGDGGMAFRGALTGKEAVAPVEKKIAAITDKADPKASKPEEKKVEAPKAEEKKAEAAKAEATKTEDKKTEVNKAEAAKAGDKKAEDKKTEDHKSEDQKTDDKKPEDKAADDKPVTKPSDAKAAAKPSDGKPSDAKPAAKSEPNAEAKADKPEDKARYTLQLSSFQDRAEAEAFLAQIKAKGYTAQITQAQVDGKGTFYRVRTGSYRSLDAATSAKSEVDKASGTSSSIMKL